MRWNHKDKDEAAGMITNNKFEPLDNESQKEEDQEDKTENENGNESFDKGTESTKKWVE